MSAPSIRPPDEPDWVISGPVPIGTYKALPAEQYFYGGRWQYALVDREYYDSVFIRHKVGSTAATAFVNTHDVPALLKRIADLEQENAALHRILTE